jgi:hypothetical protein
MTPEQREALAQFIDAPKLLEVLPKYVQTVEGRAQIAEAGIKVLSDRDRAYQCRSHLGYRWNFPSLTQPIQMEGLLKVFCAPAEILDGPVLAFMTLLDEIKMKAAVPSDDRKAVCSRHGQAYVVRFGCSYCRG